MKNLILIAGCLLLLGCETIIDMELPEVAPKLVVSSIFNKDSIPVAHLTRNRSMQEKGGYDAISNATVSIQYNSGIAVLSEGETGEYKGVSKLGLTDQLTFAASADGYGAVTSFCAVPAEPTISSVSYELVQREWDESIILDIQIQDKSEQNYYWLVMQKWGPIYEWDETDEGWMEQTYVDTGFTQISFRSIDASFNDEYHSESGVLFSDELFNGKSKRFEIELEYWNFNDLIYNQDGAEPDSAVNFDLFVELRSIDKELYDHGISYNAYQQSNGSPFVQPVRVKSNIENGLGVFSVYSATRKTVSVAHEF